MAAPNAGMALEDGVARDFGTECGLGNGTAQVQRADSARHADSARDQHPVHGAESTFPPDGDLPHCRTHSVSFGAVKDGCAGRCYLLVFEAGTSRLAHFPTDGDAVVGSAESATVRLHAASVAAQHAMISARGREATLTPLADDAETRINGEPIRGTHVLTSGDVITLGDVTLGFHRNAGLSSVRPPLDGDAFRARLGQEVERALRYQNPVALLVIDPGASGFVSRELSSAVCGVVRRVDIVGETSRSELCVIFAEAGAAAGIPASRVLLSVLGIAPDARAGLAVCPDDGCEPDALLTGARFAARSAKAGELAGVASAATTFAFGDSSVIVVDPLMKSLFALLRQLAASNLPVLINGETGSGKEIVARAIHAWSPRRSRRLTAINCAAVPEQLLESELFGYERGAFSGAVASKPGILEKANGSTILLDEVGECSAQTQAKLLRVLETQRVRRVGGAEERIVDVRVVAATNRSLEAEIVAGRFRRDLYFRLNAASVLVPPLRDRPLDIPVLARAFLDQACGTLRRSSITITPAAMQRLTLHTWPGNVRELKNLMDFVAASSSDDELAASELPAQIAASAAPWMLPRMDGVRSVAAAVSEPVNLCTEIAALEKRRMLEALEECCGVRVRAAELIGMPLRTFVTKLKVYSIVGKEIAADGSSGGT